MCIFTFEELTKVPGKRKYYKLIKNDKCLFDVFEKKFTRDFRIDFRKLFRRMENLSNNGVLPSPGQYRKIQGCPAEYELWEIKTDYLRLFYHLDEIKGFVILMGCTKNDQDNTIENAKKLIKEYLKAKDNGRVNY